MSMNKKILLVIVMFLLIAPSYYVSAAEKNISVFCYCSVENNNISCPDTCTTEAMEESIKIDCGGRNSNITSSVEYYCNPYAGVIVDNANRRGSSPLSACQNYIASESIGSQSASLKVVAKAKCEPVKEVLGEFICEEEDVLKVLSFVGYLLFFVKLLVPFLIILMGTMDYYKAITSEKTDDLSKQTQKFIKRVILGIIVFFVPAILNTFMSLLSDRSNTVSIYEKCVSCALDPINCDKD